jgi:hypothetical protein
MTRLGISAIVVTALVAASSSFQNTSAQGAAAISGEWTLNRGSSEFPREIGFTPEWMRSGLETGQPAGGERSGGRGGRRGGGSGGSSAGSTRPSSGPRESADDAKRAQLLTDEVRNPPTRLTIAASGDAVTITNDRGQARTFHVGGRQEVLHLDDVPVSATATWMSDNLVIVYDVETGHQLRYTYSVSAAPRRLRVDVQFVERGGGDSVVRLYDVATASDARPATDTHPASAGSVPASSAPAAIQPPGSELKGLTHVGVVVEDLDPKAAACGLTHGAIETAVAKALSNAGLKVAVNSDEDTYVYVNIMTSTMASGFCVSRYDVSLLTNTAATLSYQTKPALVQVSLLHKGGVSGGSASAHAAGVVQAVTQYAEQFAAQIGNANK